ncbi:hemagglutinin repeat-containing protein [Moraxella atlantae]|uniref:Hemolysin n=2 Tax=Faucicola atlantae TaxID=34059 RepID=A0A378QLL7_9GAMM|nr:hemagglutinin repeat-containing protein [Moraxella atlantae]OPH35906.1 hypothetical protein B5J92_04370 [Moraxella atlantae]STZ01735.1 Hemolysin precursor [Moraxella atlantae]
MNSCLYRVIFSKHLGRLVVVSEKTMAQGKSGSQGGRENIANLVASQFNAGNHGIVHHCYGKWLSLTAAVLVGMGAANLTYANVHTQIIVDKGAPKKEQATVLNTANGLAQVNIQTPNSQGVSKNTFSQFDVGSTGAILNNSRTNTQTQTAGWVEGNPWLAKGEAKVILNQVNSTKLSQLAGYTEIAGKKAELIIANPAGITCSGCGFINASRTTLTTGKPTFNNDTLSGFQVSSGKISIDGKGLDDSQSDYTQLISQTNAINAKVYSKQLDVITGNNTVSYEADANNTQISNTGDNHTTGVALDVSNLGGMYAGKIRLIGTDKGMGVTNAGDISSGSTLTLDNQGNLINTGFMGGKDGVAVNVNGNTITNSGTIASSQQGLGLTSSSLTNSGLISARTQGTIANTTTTNTGTLSAGQVSLTTDTLNNQGRIEQTGTGNLAVTTTGLTNQHRAVMGQALYADQPAATNLSLANAPSTAATGSQQVANNTSNSNSTTANPTPDTPVRALEPVTANGQITTKQIDNQGSNAIITANGGIDVTTQTLTNTDKSSIAVNGLQAVNSVDNQNSRIQLNNLNWQLSQFNNAQGQIVSKQGITLTSQLPINNAQGVLATLGDARIDSAGAMNNTEGVIQGKVTDIRAASLDNSHGAVDAKGSLTLTSQGDLINRQGNIRAQGDANITAAGLNNDRGAITATGQLTTQSQHVNNSGQLYGGMGNRLTSGVIDNSGIIGSGGVTTITASSLNNTSTGVLAAGLNPDGTLSTNKADLTVNTTGALTSRGTHLATGRVSLTGNPTDLAGSITQAGEISLSSDGDLSTQGAKLTATDSMTLNAKDTLNNQQGELAANTLTLTANALDNRYGSITQAGSGDLSLNLPGGLNNQDGVIATNSQNLTLNTSELNNQTGKIQHAGNGSLVLASSRVNNSQQGSVLSLGEQTWQIAGDINNSAGVIQGKRLDISANNLTNTTGVVAAISAEPTADSRIHLTGNLNNHQGTLANNARGLNVTAASVDNSSGQVVSLGQQTWQLAGNINNQGGQIQGSQFTINAQNLNNQDGIVVASHPATANSAVNLTGNLTNTGNAVIYAGNGSLNITANQIDNAAQLTSRDNLTTTSQTFTNSGNVYAGGNASVTNQGQLTNSATIAAGKHITIDTGSLNQTAEGQLIAGLSPEGTLATTPANLTVTSRDAQTNAGVNVATGDLTVTGSALDYTSSQNQAQNIAFTAKTGDVNLTGAQSQAAGQIAITTPATWVHDKGVMQADHYQLAAGNIVNQAGTIIQTGTNDLTIHTGNFNNQGGQVGGSASNLNVTATGDINNQDGALIHTGSGNVNISSANVNNTRGQLVTNGGLTLNGAGTLTNDAGVIQAAQATVSAGQISNQASSNQGGLILTSSGDLTLNGNLNSQGNQSVIQSAHDLNVNGGSITNGNGAMLSATNALNVKADQLTNDQAVIVANQAVGISAGSATNAGSIASVNDTVNIAGGSLTNTESGNIQAAKAITITQANIANQGVITSNDALNVTGSGAIDNHSGILAGSNVALAAQTLNNNAGLISQSAADGSLTITTQGLLDNQNTKSNDAATKPLGMLANGIALINAGDVNNQSGRINANTVTLTSTGSSVNNNQGEIAANQALSLNAGNANVSNQTGQLLGHTTNVTVAGLDNTNQGLVLANQDLTVNAGTINNSNTKQASDATLSQGFVASGNATLTAAVVNNTNGQIVTGDSANLNVSQSLTNQSGRIESNQVKVGGNASVDNNTGLIKGHEQVDLTGKGLTNTGGQLRAPTLNVALTDSYTHGVTDKLEADNLSLTTQGDFTNQGKLAASTRLAVSAQNIDHQKDASLESGDLIELNATNNIQNRGLIHGSRTYLTAGNTLDNLSYGRIYGDYVAIKADTLNNTPNLYTKTKVDYCEPGSGCAVEYKAILPISNAQVQTSTDIFGNPIYESDPSLSQAWIDAHTTYEPTYYAVTSEPAPVIAARNRLDIGVKQLNNNPNPARAGIFNPDFNGQAQLLSNGELHIGGDLDNSYQAVGSAQTITNLGATIQSARNMHIKTDSLLNGNSTFRKINEVTSVKEESKWQFKDDSKKRFFFKDELYKRRWDYYTKDTNEKLGEDYRDYDYKIYTLKDRVVASDPARIISGQDIFLEGTDLKNDKGIILAGQTGEIHGKELINNVNPADTLGKESSLKEGFYQLKEVHCHALCSKKSLDDIGPKTPFIEVGESTSFKLPILNANIKDIDTMLPPSQAATVDNLSKAVTALATLQKSTQTANNATTTTDNSNVAKQDAINLLSEFAKANPDTLTPKQQKQLDAILKAQKEGKSVSQAQLNGLIDSLNGSIKSQYTEEVRVTGNGPTLPNSSLYNVDPNNPNGYLIETDPAFANYKKWLSSDYMMQRLGLDPSNLHKRLGDGYYEQGLIRDQVMSLTGRRFLGDYTTDDAMYQALMDNGVTVAQAMNLRPGIALTAEQMAQLTTDIVWLVEQTITLKDGSKQTVLVPKVYVRAKVGDLKGDGSLIAARNVAMQLTGDLSNQGNIVAHNGLRIQTNNLNNQNGGLIQGNFVQVNTKNDLNNIGATLKTNSAMALDIGGNLNNSSSTYHTESKLGQSNAWRTGIDQIGQIYVGDGLQGMTDDNSRPLTTLSIDVGGNATFNAGQLINQGGSTRMVAQGDVAFNALNTGFQTNAIGDSNNYYKVGQTQDVGSVVASQGSSYIQSKGGSITGTAVTIHSEDGTSYLDAKKDILLKEGRATSNLETANKTTDKGLLSRKTTQDRNSATSDEAISGNVTGDRLVINAGNDIQLTATNAISQSGTTLKAGNNLTIDAATNNEHQSSSHNEKKSGLFSNGGASFTLGSQKTANQNSTDTTTHTGSVVGTYNGNTVLTAGEHYQQTGSKVYAKNQTTDDVHDLNYGTVVINAKSANVDNTVASSESHSSQRQKTSGLTVKVSNSLVDQAQDIQDLAKAGQTTNRDQMKVMAGVAGFSKLRTLDKGATKAVDSIQKGGISKEGLSEVGNTRIQATLGRQSSSSTHDSLLSKNEASSIEANNLVLNIQGKGKDSDFTVTGSDINLAGDLYNHVEGDVTYQAASGTGYDRTSHQSSGFGVGGYASTQSGAGITANANMAKGYGNETHTTNANSHINVGGTTYQNIGGNLVLDGAVVKGDYATGHIGGGIIAASRQDTAKYDGKNTNAGFSADIDLSKAGTGSNLSVNGGRTRANADYAAVTEQTGLQYRKSDMVVDGKSTFKGAYFTTATPEDNQTQFNGGLEVSDIQNHSQYKADGIGVGLSAGMNPTTNQMNPPGISGIGYGRDSDSQTSTTYGAVTGMAGKSDVTTANVSSLNETLENSFDKTAVEAQLGAQVQISQEYGKEIPKAIGDYAGKKQLELINAGDTEKAKKWSEGGVYRVALHTLSSALATGSIEGAVAGGGTAIVVPKVDEYLKNQGYDEDTRKVVLVGLSAGVGGAVGDSIAGLANSVNQTQNNYLNHIQLQQWAEQLAACGKDIACKQNINTYYQALSKEQDKRLERVCITNFNHAQCKTEIANFYQGFPKNKIAPFADDYTKIESLGGGNLRANVTMSNDLAFSNTITRGIANIARAENRPMDAIAADLMYAELWGGGAGRLGTVSKAKPSNNAIIHATPQEIQKSRISMLQANGVKISSENVVTTGITPTGKIVFLETGSSKAGLQHIVERHAAEFNTIGVSNQQIPSVLINTLEHGKIVGYQGKKNGRPIYQTVINGQTRYIAISVGSNGFIVGANPVSKPKK